MVTVRRADDTHKKGLYPEEDMHCIAGSVMSLIKVSIAESGKADRVEEIQLDAGEKLPSVRLLLRSLNLDGVLRNNAGRARLEYQTVAPGDYKITHNPSEAFLH